jgi:hypothetical protein
MPEPIPFPTPVVEPVAPTSSTQVGDAAAQAAAKAAEPAKITQQQAEIYARKEKALLSRAKQLKQQEADLKAREAGMVSRDRLKQSPLEVLAELGIQPHEVAQSLLNAPQPLSKAEVELETLKQEIAALKAQRIEDSEGSVAQALQQIRTDTKELVARDPRFETIQATGQQEEVVTLIKAVFDKEGTVLSVEEAARLIEEQLEQDEFKRFERLSRLSKIQKRLKPQPAAEGSAPLQAGNPRSPETKPSYRTRSMPAKITPRDPRPIKQVRTLTNSLTSSTRELSSRERAILAFSNKLSG